MKFIKAPEYLFIDIVTNPIHWYMQNNQYDVANLLNRYGDNQFIIYRRGLFFNLIAPVVGYSNGHYAAVLSPGQARQFWNAYKKWCALTRNEIKP